MTYRANVTRFYVFSSLVYFHLWMPIWVLFFQHRGMNLTQIGTLDAIGWIVMAIAEVPTGAIADIYGRKTSLALGAVLNAAALIAVTAEVFSPVFLIGYLLWGASFTLFSGADAAFLYDSLAADGQASQYAKITGRKNAIVQASQAFGSLAGAWLAGFDMSLCFSISGALALVAAGVALTFREPPRHDVPAATSAAPAPGYWQTIREAVRIAANRPAVRDQILLGALVPVFNFLLTFILLQPYAAAAGVPVANLGAVVLAVRGASVLGSMAAHRVSARIGPHVLVPAAVAIMVASHALLAVSGSPGALALFAVVSLASALIPPTLSQLLNERIPSAQRATIISLQALLWTLALAVVEPPLLAVASRAGVPFAIGLSGVILAVTALPTLLLWRRSMARAGSDPSMETA